MPSSRFETIPLVLDFVTRMQPKSILDLGIGTGKFGMLFREYLDVWKVDKPYNERVLTLIGVEAFEEYDNPVWEVYDKVYVKNIFDILDELPPVDLLFLGDVIEHFTKEDGKRLLERLDYKYAIIVTPLKVSSQTEVYNNPYEKHISSWTKDDFPDAQIYLVNNQQVIVYAKGSQTEGNL